MHFRAPNAWIALSVRQGSALALAAAVGGIYLGGSTVAEIDPFYKSVAAQATGSSYTIDGWRGADATSPPSEAPIADYPDDRFGGNAHSGRTYSYEVVAAVPAVLESVSHVGDAARKLVGEDSPIVDSQSDLAADAGYECVGCSGPPDAEPANASVSVPREMPSSDDDSRTNGESGYTLPQS